MANKKQLVSRDYFFRGHSVQCILNEIAAHPVLSTMKLEDISLEYEYSSRYDDSRSLCFRFQELETDEEFMKRLENERKRREYEREQYERLKKKFEK